MVPSPTWTRRFPCWIGSRLNSPSERPSDAVTPSFPDTLRKQPAERRAANPSQPMRTLLNLPEPSADWRGLANVIARSADLRDDVTLVVEQDRLRFFDAECREIQTDLLPGAWTHGAMKQLAAKLSLLDWLHERFSQQTPSARAQDESRPARSYFNHERDARGNRSAATQSTF
jgi:hypothetical protein